VGKEWMESMWRKQHLKCNKDGRELNLYKERKVIFAMDVNDKYEKCRSVKIWSEHVLSC